jgi:hypothetical protein
MLASKAGAYLTPSRVGCKGLAATNALAYFLSYMKGFIILVTGQSLGVVRILVNANIFNKLEGLSARPFFTALQFLCDLQMGPIS